MSYVLSLKRLSEPVRLEDGLSQRTCFNECPCPFGSWMVDGGPNTGGGYAEFAAAYPFLVTKHTRGPSVHRYPAEASGSAVKLRDYLVDQIAGVLPNGRRVASAGTAGSNLKPVIR